MTREVRYKLAGTLFYITILIGLISTEHIFSILRTFSDSKNISEIRQLIIALVGVGTVLLTSDSIGYVFGSIHIYFWNFFGKKNTYCEGGYSSEWGKLTIDIKKIIIDRYNREEFRQLDENIEFGKFESNFNSYSFDVFLSYFWQQAPKPIVDWVVRRHTAFFTGMSAMIAIIFGYILSFIFACIISYSTQSKFYFHIVIVIVLAIICVILYSNAQHARNEAYKLMDFWIATRLNSKLKNVVENI